MTWTWLILCLFADIFYLVSCNCNTNCSEVICAKGDSPICHSSKCVCKRHTGICFSDDECRYGHCDHPMCDTSSNHCHCGHLPRHHHHCSSDLNCTSLSSHCGSGIHSRCYHGYCYCLEKFYVTECGHHSHHHHDEVCPPNSCPSSYSEICSNNLCGCILPPIDGGWSHFGHYGACSVSCGGGVSTRSRTCSNPAPKWGGEDCSGSSTETSSCNTNPCPVDGSWSAWGAWGHCSGTCGGGTRERHRTCTHPAPSHGGANCVGSPRVTESCNTQHCPVAGSWSAWGAWGKCSVTCGGGTHERHRMCSNPAPSHGGPDCVGSTTLTHHCNSDHCPIDGSWSAWGAWGHCSVTCDGGTKERHRTCSNPVPSHGGTNCVGSNQNSHNCNDASCPTAAPGVPCPVCDATLNCVWGNECPDNQTCMIRSYPNYNFTVHCSIRDDCHFIKDVTTTGEIYCCDDRQCLRNILGL